MTTAATATTEQIKQAIANYKDKVDYLEIRVEQSESTGLSFRGKQLDSVDRSFSLGGGIRACHAGGWSFVTFNGLKELNERIEEAISQAKLVGKEETQLAKVEPIEDFVPEEIKRDPRKVPLKEKRTLLEAYNEILLNFDPRIQTTMASIGDRFATKTFATLRVAVSFKKDWTSTDALRRSPGAKMV